MFLLKSFPIGQTKRRAYRFQIYRNNRLITQVGFYDPYTCRGGVNLCFLHFYLRKGLIIYYSRYHFVIFLLIGGFNLLNYNVKYPRNIKSFLILQSPYRSKFQKYQHQFRKYKHSLIYNEDFIH
jgi:hypothetical protein